MKGWYMMTRFKKITACTLLMVTLIGSMAFPTFASSCCSRAKIASQSGTCPCGGKYTIYYYFCPTHGDTQESMTTCGHSWW